MTEGKKKLFALECVIRFAQSVYESVQEKDNSVLNEFLIINGVIFIHKFQEFQ